MKKILSLITTLLISIISISQITLPNIEKQVIVAPKKGHELEFSRFVNDNGLKVLQKFDELNWYVLEIPANETQDGFIKKYRSNSSINKIYKNEVMIYEKEYIPNDTQFNGQWFLKQLNDADVDADLAWDSLPINNVAVKVAVFDGGNDITHEDLNGNIVTPFNAVTNSFSNGELVDPIYDRHGTACSGTIAAVTNNGRGVASIGNNKVKVMPINIMTFITAGGSFGTTTAIQVNAINAAMSNGCVAISMSYGGSSFSQALNDAFIIAKNQGRGGKGLFICASTGNGSSGTITQYPASYPAIYGIGATTSSDLRASFSNYGNIVDISAPGSAILTTDLTGANGYSSGNYASVSGTSFSCPITAAAGAILIYKNQDLTEAQVMTVLAQTAEKVGNYVYETNPLYPLSSRSIQLGYGRINLANAVNAVPLVGNPIDNPPSAQHNIVIVNCNVNSSSPIIGSTITITTTQKTTAPQLEAISPKLQYRLSNDNLWSADDLIMGSDTSNLGNNIETEIETLNYVIPSNLLGTKFILIRGNFDGAVNESTSVDNTCSMPITIVNPGATGLDLRAFWIDNSVTVCGTNTSPSTGSIGTTRLRFQNMGSIPITTFTAKVYWENCPWSGLPSSFNCNVWQTSPSIPTPVIQPNGFSGTYQFTTCIVNCGLAANPYTLLAVGETRNLVLEILTVNGQAGDSFLGNNKAFLPITRLSCTSASTNGEEIIVAEPIIKIYSITGMPIENISMDNLASGIYIISTIHPDGSVVSKKFFK